MNHSRRFDIARLARTAAVLALALVLASGRLLAQGTTGKIEGTVKDQAGAPIAGAQVLIVGTAFASTSNEQGYYFINNVPAGVMTVRSQYIGYAPSEVRNVRVFAGQTMTVNLQLEQRAIEVGGITVTSEANPIVPRDNVASKAIVAGDLVQALPVGNVTEALRLQPGVVQGDRGLTVRGGRPGEAIIYVDGVPVRSTSGNTSTGSLTALNNGGNGSQRLGANIVGTAAIEEASVTTGAIGASQGDAQSGVISYVTRSGGQSFKGFLSVASDDLAGEVYGQGLNRLEASLSGPLAGNLTFFVSSTMEGRQSPRQGLGAENFPVYVLNGIDTTVTVALSPGVATSDSQQVALPAFTRYSTGMRRPDNWSSDWNLDGKLQYTFGGGSRISASYHRTRNQGLNSRVQQTLYDPQSQSGFLNTSSQFIVNWAQNLARSSERALFLNAAFSIQKDVSNSGLVDQTWFNDNHKPFGWFGMSDVKLVFNQDNFPLTDRLLENFRVNNCKGGTAQDLCVPYLLRNDLALSQSYRVNPYGITASPNYFATSGIGNPGIGLNAENRTTGSANLDWQADRYNRVQIGGDFVSSDSKNYACSTTNLIFCDVSYYKPNRYGLYATDRLDLGDVVVDLGLRFDHTHSDVMYPYVPGRLFTDPMRDSTNGLKSAVTAQDTAIFNTCRAALRAVDTLSWSTCDMFPGADHSVLLPSIRISFPVTDRTGFRLSYAQQAQNPDFNLLARGVNTDLAITNTNQVFGRDLNYGKSILFEFGIRHAFSSDMVLDISAYNKDKVSDITARVIPVWDPQTRNSANLKLMTNADFGNVRGVDVRLDRRVGSLFQGSISYTFEQAKSTGSDPFQYLNTYARLTNNVTGDLTQPPQAALTTNDNRDHTIAGSLALNFPHGWHEGSALGSILQDFGAFATFRFASGLAYTRFAQAGLGTTGPGNGFGLVGLPAEPLNSSSTPWIKNVDLRLTRAFRMGARDLTVFADFRNLFNWTNITGLFVETGDVVNSVYQTNQLSPIKVNLANEAGALVKQCQNVAGAVCTSATETGIDLTSGSVGASCTNYLASSTAGIPNCIMLRRAEARFGNGDNFFSDSEQNAAFGAWYNLGSGPYQFKGPGLNFRLGFELNF